MQHSSRKIPCPVCGRTKDDKCRWSNTRIYCYIGDSFSPPLGLRIGEKIKIAGEKWRLFSRESGFAQNSFAFALDEGDDYRFLTYEDKRGFRKNCIRLTRIFLQKQKSLFFEISKLSQEDLYHTLKIDEFYANKKSVKNLLVLLKDFDDFSFTNKRYLADSGIDIHAAKSLLRQMKDRLDAIYMFERLYFDSASPETEDLRAEPFVF